MMPRKNKKGEEYSVIVCYFPTHLELQIGMTGDCRLELKDKTRNKKERKN